MSQNSPLSGQICLVTGADGFIGSHLTELLLATGANVRALALYNSFGQIGWLSSLDSKHNEKLEIVSSDIRDPHAMAKLCQNCNYIFHLASLIAIPYSYRAPHSYVETNVLGTLNLLEGARAAKSVRFIQVSTSEVYGSANYTPIDENHPLVAQSPYAASKIAADQMAIAFHRSFDLSVTLIRPFNTFGPRQSARAIIPTIILQLLDGAETLRLGALKPTRDFTFVGDTVTGILRAAERDIEGEVIQLGTGREISIGELAQTIAGLMKKKVSISEDSARLRPESSEVDRLVCSNQKAATLLNWRPSIDLPDGLRKTIDWFSQDQNRAHYRTDHSF